MSVDATRLRRVVERLADERPDFVYQIPDGEDACLYTHRDDEGTEVPGCLIGTALHVLGQPIGFDHEWNRNTGVVNLAHLGFITGKYYDVEWLIGAQNEQDCGTPWGDAVAEATIAESAHDYDV